MSTKDMYEQLLETILTAGAEIGYYEDEACIEITARDLGIVEEKLLE